MISSIVKKNPSVKTFIVGAIGLNEMEVNSFKRLFSITRVRNRDYDIRVIPDCRRADFSDIDMIMIDGRAPESLVDWRAVRKTVGELGYRPVISITHSRCANKLNGYQLSTPFNPSRVLKMLDRFTIKELNFLPEFEIGSESSNQVFAKEGIALLSSKKTSGENSLKALVVDDSLAVRKQLEIEFGLFDVSVEMADNGFKACQAIQSTKYDIIFLDVVMDGDDGYTVCKKIRRDALNKKTPVILLTSKSSTVDRLKGTLAGCNSYLTKPISHSDFVQETKKFVDLYQYNYGEIQ